MKIAKWKDAFFGVASVNANSVELCSCFYYPGMHKVKQNLYSICLDINKDSVQLFEETCVCNYNDNLVPILGQDEANYYLLIDKSVTPIPKNVCSDVSVQRTPLFYH